MSNKIIFIEGMNASGSSAVSDFIADSPQVISTKTPSVRVLRARYGLNDLYKYTGDRKKFQKAISDFYYINIIGAKWSPTKSFRNFLSDIKRIALRKKKGNVGEPERARKIISQPYGYLALEAFERFARITLENDDIKNAFENAVGDFVFNYLVAASGEDPGKSRILATRNFFRLPAINKELLKFMGDYRYIAVTRSPHTQYASLLRNGRVKGPKDFLRMREKSLNSMNYNLQCGDIDKSRFLHVEFEDFVDNHLCRANVADFVGVEVEKIIPKRFNPRESSRNTVLNNFTLSDEDYNLINYAIGKK